MTLTPSVPTGGNGNGNGGGGNDGDNRTALAARLRALEHAMRTPVGTLAASLELLNAAGGPQGMEGTVQIMARQVRLLTSQLEQLHDIGRDLAAAERGPSA